MMPPRSEPAAGTKRRAPASQPQDDTAPVWVFIWTLFGFKMATVALMLYHLRAWESDLVIVATTWYWFPMLAVLLAAPIAYRYRLRKARARRRELMRAEWMLTDDEMVPSGRAGESAGR